MLDQRPREFLLDEEEEEEEDLAKQMADMKAHGKVLLDGVEYKVESVATPPRHCSTPPSYNATPPSYCGSSGYPSLVFMSLFVCLVRGPQEIGRAHV